MTSYYFCNTVQKSMGERKLKEKKSSIGIIALFIVGLCIILYPTISNMWNQKRQSQAVETYSNQVKDMESDKKKALLEQAQQYNQKLLSENDPIKNHVDDYEYDNMLSVDDTRIMGYISIPQIDVKLPIYHGTGDEAISQGVGHLQGSSLPVGGEGTHCVLSSHRGLPKAKLFTDLDRLNVGDRFSLTVLDQTIIYQVDLISIVEPEELDKLMIEDGKDYCTLLTCTPYGVNTQRLLVRGSRVNEPTIVVENEARRINTLYVAVVIAIPIILILLLYMMVKDRKKK